MTPSTPDLLSVHATPLPRCASTGVSLLLAGLLTSLAAAEKPFPPPVRYVGSERATIAADGGLRPVIGVKNIQVVRANRSHPELAHADGLAHTYLHAPMLAFWRGHFHLEYLSGPRDEHQAPCVTSITRSADGVHWEKPRVAFPAFRLPDGSETVAHQRMGWYVAPNGRLLALAFYGRLPSPNDGTGVGRAVREVFPDGSFGPLHFIFLNRSQGWNESNVPYPLYSQSSDAGFVAACEALLANKLFTNQWWEEQRFEESFFTVDGKAMCFYHRRDGAVVGLWKDAVCALSHDEGVTWTPQPQAANVPSNGSKYWGQRTSDGRYAITFNPTYRNRHPLAVMLSDDGATFDHLYAVHGELPPQRFPGAYKNLGPQYVRGILEGNAAPAAPDDAMWLTYSVNKEDIWVARVPVPIRATAVAGVARDDFENTAPGAMPDEWNIYRPLWAPVQVVDTNGRGDGHALELRDEDPYDYARAIRVFPETHGLDLALKVFPHQTDARLELELTSAHGARPVRIAFGEDGHLWADHEGIWKDAGAYAADTWTTLELRIAANPHSDRAEFRVNGREVLHRPPVFSEPAASVERLSIRTGAFRDRGTAGKVLPGADEKAPAAVFWIDDVVIEPQQRDAAAR